MKLLVLAMSQKLHDLKNDYRAFTDLFVNNEKFKETFKTLSGNYKYQTELCKKHGDSYGVFMTPLLLLTSVNLRGISDQINDQRIKILLEILGVNVDNKKAYKSDGPKTFGYKTYFFSSKKEAKKLFELFDYLLDFGKFELDKYCKDQEINQRYYQVENYYEWVVSAFLDK